MNERKLWHYPPYGAQALIRVSADTEKAGVNFLSKLATSLRTQLEVEQLAEHLELLGPIPSPLAKRASRYRFQLLVSSSQRGQLHAVIEQTLSLLIQSRRTGGVRWVIDIDPMDFL